MTYHIYTDGSCRNNGTANAVGAWGFAVYQNDTRIHEDVGILTTNATNATNQRAELFAIINACRWAESHITGPFDEVHIYTDSAYVYNCFTQKWYMSWQRNNWLNSKKQPVANRELWEQLIPFFEWIQFNFHKVAGHADNTKNNYVDALVQKASLEYKK